MLRLHLLGDGLLLLLLLASLLVREEDGLEGAILVGDLLRKVNVALPEGRWEACPVAVGRDLHFQGSNPTCICKACKNCHFNIIHLTTFRKKKKHHNDMSFGHLCQSLLTSWLCHSPGPRTTSSTSPPSHLNKKIARKNIFFQIPFSSSFLFLPTTKKINSISPGSILFPAKGSP